MGDLLNIHEVSERTSVPAATLRYWRHTGTGPKSFRIGKRIAYRREDVDAWLQKQYADTVVGG